MKKFMQFRAITKKHILLFGIVFAQIFTTAVYAQKGSPKTPANNQAKPAETASKLPKVTQIDTIALQNLLKRGENAKPLLINFWATWCDPCRDEFPELVKINADYLGKIDFITISLDDAAIISSDVPKFLLDMKSLMPAYLLNTDDESAAIASIAKDWQGGLPFTVLLNAKGETVYTREGKINARYVRDKLDKILSGEVTKPAENTKSK